MRVLVRVLMSGRAALLLLGLHLSHPRLLGLVLLLDVLDKLRDAHAGLLGVSSQLSLHHLNLLRRWALAGDGHWDLARARHLAGLRRRRGSHSGRCMCQERV